MWTHTDTSFLVFSLTSGGALPPSEALVRSQSLEMTSYGLFAVAFSFSLEDNKPYQKRRQRT